MVLLCADLLGVDKEASEGVNLNNSNSEHDRQVYAGPKGHSPQVVLQKVAVSRLKCPQHGLDLMAFLQVPVHRVHSCLEGDKKDIKWI